LDRQRPVVDNRLYRYTEIAVTACRLKRLTVDHQQSPECTRTYQTDGWNIDSALADTTTMITRGTRRRIVGQIEFAPTDGRRTITGARMTNEIVSVLNILTTSSVQQAGRQPTVVLSQHVLGDPDSTRSDRFTPCLLDGISAFYEDSQSPAKTSCTCTSNGK